MIPFPPVHYPLVLQKLLQSERLAALGPGKPEKSMEADIGELTLEKLFPKLENRDLGQCCLAGLWLYFDFLEESHLISQEIHTKTGSFWHAIMHRREPDAFNSKYWWRNVGFHPVIEELKHQAPALGYPYTNPSDFVDYCERVRDSETGPEKIAKRVQLMEWQLLFDFCYRGAMGL